MVLITEPHNPSGVFSSRESAVELADICAKNGAILLINEVYVGYTARPSLHGIADNVLIVNSCSKLLGAYANRVGWLSGPKPLTQRLRWASMNMGAGLVPSAAVGIGFAKQAAKRTVEARRLALAGVDIVDRWVQSRPNFKWIPPECPALSSPGRKCIAMPRQVESGKGSRVTAEKKTSSDGTTMAQIGTEERSEAMRAPALSTDTTRTFSSTSESAG